jgi:hypothetical protein
MRVHERPSSSPDRDGRRTVGVPDGVAEMLSTALAVSATARSSLLDGPPGKQSLSAPNIGADPRFD